MWAARDVSPPNDFRVMREWLAQSHEYADERKFFLVDVMLWRSRSAEYDRRTAAR
jgi:hypothetical protein